MSRSTPGARRRAGRSGGLRRVVAVVLAVAVTAGVVYVGIRLGRPDRGTPSAAPTASASDSSTPLASMDLSALPIERGPFCDVLDEGDVESALGGPVSDTGHYQSGDRAVLSTGVTDVSHEFNCTFEASTGARGRVWVFAEPVRPPVARALARDSRSEKGCDPVEQAPAYGTPSVATLCEDTKPPESAVTLQGLFGDAWLSCQLSTPGVSTEETVRRAEQWCVEVATTLGARP